MLESMTLIEQCADWRAGVEVERETGLVRNVALAGSASRNGYVYRESALRAAAPLYEKKPVFLDHGVDKHRPQERSTRDLVGSVVNARYEAGRIRGDIRVLETDSGQMFLALVAADTPGIGMSHVVLAERSRDGAIVERIADVISVDAVVGPATTTTFRESCEHANGGDVGDDEESPAATSGAPEREHLAAALRRAEAERDALRERLEAAAGVDRARLQRESIARQLSESGLPGFAVTDIFRRLLEAEDDAAKRKALIAERCELLRHAAETQPRSAERRRAADVEINRAFAAAVRGARRQGGPVSSFNRTDA